MATQFLRPVGDDPALGAEIAKLNAETGPASAGVTEARCRLRLQAQRCAAGNHTYTWTGQVVDLPGRSLHQVMACAYSALHAEGQPSPTMIGPPHTPENTAKHLWSKHDLKDTVSPA